VAEYPILASGTSRVPLGGTAVVNILARVSGVEEDVTSVQVILKNNSGTTISNQTYTNADISTTASDGGAITLANPVGVGTYRWTYVVPSNSTYTPPAAGLQFSVQVIIVDEDGGSDTGAIPFFVVPADVTVAFDATSVSGIVKRRTGLLIDRLVTGEMVRTGSRTTLDVGAGPVYAIQAIYKNGTTLVAPTNYTWNTYSSRVTLIVPAVDTDEFLIQAQVRMSDTALNDLINESSDTILPALRAHYDDADLATRALTEALIAMRTAGKVKIELCKGSRDNVDFAEGAALVREAEAITKAIQRGEMDVLDADGAAVARRDNALAGGFRNEDDLAITSRLQMVDQLQRWHGLIEYFWPEQGLATSPRTFP
jgi:hypothetical protein